MPLAPLYMHKLTTSEVRRKATIHVIAAVAVAWLWGGEAKAYQLRAIESSFLGTNSTSAPEIQWLRYREGNGSASISVATSGTKGEVGGTLSLQRVSSEAASVA